MKFTMDPRKVPDGTVMVMGIRYASQTSDKVWTYVWLKAGGLWYGTGNARVPTAAGWGAVERWLEADGREVLWIDVVTGMERIYEPPVEALPGVRVTRLAGMDPMEARAERIAREPGLG